MNDHFCEWVWNLGKSSRLPCWKCSFSHLTPDPKSKAAFKKITDDLNAHENVRNTVLGGPHLPTYRKENQGLQSRVALQGRAGTSSQVLGSPPAPTFSHLLLACCSFASDSRPFLVHLLRSWQGARTPLVGVEGMGWPQWPSSSLLWFHILTLLAQPCEQLVPVLVPSHASSEGLICLHS